MGGVPNASTDFFWDELLQLIEEESVVPIVGPGLLTLELPDGSVHLHQLLAQRLGEALGVPADDLPAGGELNEIACRYLAQGKKWQRLYSALKTVMPADQDLPIPKPLLQLAEIRPFKLFVTSTFDSLLERAVRMARSAHGEEPKCFAYAPNDRGDLPCGLGSLGSPAVFYLFGRLSATPSYALTEEDTLEFMHALQTRDQQPQLLFDEFERRSLLFLGGGFSGWLARFFLRMAKNHPLRSVRDSTDYFADTRVRDDPNLVVFLERFSSGTEIFPDGGAVEFVDELHRRWKERQPEPEREASSKPARSPLPGSAGAAFLSYASEDREAARVLKEALEAANIDVFFDKQDLRAGDDFKSKLKRAIRDCCLFIPLISKHTLTEQRRFFRREWRYALDEALAAPGRFIVPVVIDDSSPDAEFLPDRFRDLHWEPAPRGRPNPEFIAQVRNDFRAYQKLLVSAP